MGKQRIDQNPEVEYESVSATCNVCGRPVFMSRLTKMFVCTTKEFEILTDRCWVKNVTTVKF